MATTDLRSIKHIFYLTLFSLLASCSGDKEKASKDVDYLSLDTTEKKVSYFLGYSVATEISKSGIDPNKAALAKAIADVSEKKDLALSVEEMRSASTIFQSFVREKQLADERQKNIEFGKQFLSENLSRNGIEATKSGIQYKILEPGSDGTPSSDSLVSVYYKGALLDGTVFENSFEQSEPVSFYLDEVIPGWAETIPLMQKNARWKLWVPHHLAFPNGTQSIPAGSTLEFEIELVDFN